MSRPAVFLDRDGTINEEMGYINHVSRLKLLPGVSDAIRLLNQAGVPAVVVTNQSGAARGYFPPELVTEVHRRLQTELAQDGAYLAGLYTCLHGPEDNCPCRKPKPALILQAARELDLDLARSYLVGDRYRDVETAANAGVKGILVLTGYGRGEYQHLRGLSPAQPVYVAEDLADAAAWILADLEKASPRQRL